MKGIVSPALETREGDKKEAVLQERKILVRDRGSLSAAEDSTAERGGGGDT